MNMSDFLNLNLTDVPEPVLLPEGEYLLEVAKAPEEKTNPNSGKTSILVCLRATEVPDSEMIFHNINLPHVDDEASKVANKKRQYKQALDALGIEYGPDGIAPYEEWVGRNAYAKVVIESDQQYGDRNRVKSFTRSA